MYMCICIYSPLAQFVVDILSIPQIAGSIPAWVCMLDVMKKYIFLF